MLRCAGRESQNKPTFLGFRINKPSKRSGFASPVERRREGVEVGLLAVLQERLGLRQERRPEGVARPPRQPLQHLERNQEWLGVFHEHQGGWPSFSSSIFGRPASRRSSTCRKSLVAACSSFSSSMLSLVWASFRLTRSAEMVFCASSQPGLGL